jgi:type VI secretion system secreted protein Hcp
MAGTASPAFVNFPKIPGEATAKGYEKQIGIHSLSLGMFNPVNLSAGSGGMSGGVASVTPINFTKEVDSASPLLIQANVLGTHMDNATVTLLRTGGGSQPYLIITLTDVYIESVNIAASGNEIGHESVSFVYGAFQIDYYAQDSASGVGSKKSTASYSVLTGAQP